MKILLTVVLISGLAVFANAQKMILTGTVYDPNGAVIVKAKVTAENQKGEKFEALTDEDGVYKLMLPYFEKKQSDVFRITKYDIAVESHGFEKFKLKDFKVVGGYNKHMQLDLALDVLTIVDPITVPSAIYKQ